MSDNVNHPSHYNQVQGIECIEVVKHFDFVIGNAIKYLWRLGHKGGGDQRLEDLKKARWYLDYAIKEEEQRRLDEDNRSQR